MVVFLRVPLSAKKKPSPPSYAYLRICVFSKEITALGESPTHKPMCGSNECHNITLLVNAFLLSTNK